MRGKAQGADCRDEKGDCGNQGKRKKRELTKTVSLKNCGAVGKENDFQIPSAHHETAIGSSRNLSMPTEHAAKIRIYTFSTDATPKGQAKSPALFLSEQYRKMWRHSSEHCSEHCSDRTSKNLFYAAVGKEKDGTFFTSTEKHLTKSCNKYRK